MVGEEMGGWYYLETFSFHDECLYCKRYSYICCKKIWIIYINSSCKNFKFLFSFQFRKFWYQIFNQVKQILTFSTINKAVHNIMFRSFVFFMTKAAWVIWKTNCKSIKIQISSASSKSCHKLVWFFWTIWKMFMPLWFYINFQLFFKLKKVFWFRGIWKIIPLFGNERKQAGAELCQAQGKLRLARLWLFPCFNLID